MVSGSGTQNRDEEILEHKPFLVMADFLARNGIASLRYDDRGAGKSTGRPDSCTTADFAADAQAGMEWLKRNKGWKTGVLGHSEGGTIAFILGAKGQADFIVSMGGWRNSATHWPGSTTLRDSGPQRRSGHSLPPHRPTPGSTSSSTTTRQQTCGRQKCR